MNYDVSGHNRSANAAALLQIGPNLSIDQLNTIAPYQLTRPNVGRNSVTPHVVHGETIDPNVSLPIQEPTRPAAVADASRTGGLAKNVKGRNHAKPSLTQTL